VYAAFDPQLDRRVALKVVRPDLAGEDHHDRLLKEARALARLTHPNVVSVHDAGVHERSFFVAMELVVGATLSAWARKHSPGWRQLRDVLVEAGRGLDAAHRAGLVHRDFKPSNVLISGGPVGLDGEGRVRVVDFGLAHAVTTEPGHGVAANATAEELATHSGGIMGTPVYMAPEQFAGRTSAASDQWSFCVTAYELLYGERPFAARSIDELRALVSAGSVPDPSNAAGVPAWMLRVLRRGLSVDPRDRFPSMRDLMVAMCRDRARSHRRLWIGAALVGVLAIAAVASVLRDETTADNAVSISQLESAAREAAAIGAFIYPPVEDPTRATA
jgi:serine/threonine protein kinase